MNVWVEERKDRTIWLSDDNRPTAVKYYQLHQKVKKFENILTIWKNKLDYG
jgi:acyl-coenzyme A synthetase/AMP-(fatty) acid ligase